MGWRAEEAGEAAAQAQRKEAERGWLRRSGGSGERGGVGIWVWCLYASISKGQLPSAKHSLLSLESDSVSLSLESDSYSSISTIRKRPAVFFSIFIPTHGL